MLLVAALTAAGPARAQIVPRINVPTLPRDLLRAPLGGTVTTLRAAASLQSLRRTTVQALLREHADVLEADPAGEPVRRRELLLVSPAPSTVAAALALGYALLREQDLPELDLRQVVLRVPTGLSTADALDRLRAIDPALEADFNHVYTRSGNVTSMPASAPALALTTTLAPVRVGLVDSGVMRRHPALRHADIHAWGCADAAVPSTHGTAVASLLVGRDDAFAGAAPSAVLYAADVYCGNAAGGSVESIAQALAWLAREQVGVVNLSLVGPADRMLESAVRAMTQRGHLIVAAVGNDGPAAPPLYPAAYPGVVGVTAVLPSRRVLPEAAQGAQVMFAAPGAEIAVADGGSGYAVARGTSFAAPLVAGLLAPWLRTPDPVLVSGALQRLADLAIDLGAPGRDPVFGIGLVGEAARVAPERVQAHARW